MRAILLAVLSGVFLSANAGVKRDGLLDYSQRAVKKANLHRVARSIIARPAPKPYNGRDTDRASWKSGAIRRTKTDTFNLHYRESRVRYIYEPARENTVSKISNGQLDRSFHDYEGEMYDYIIDKAVIRSNPHLNAVAALVEVDIREVKSVSVLTLKIDRGTGPNRIYKFLTADGREYTAELDGGYYEDTSPYPVPGECDHIVIHEDEMT